jgi:hypothetical protein
MAADRQTGRRLCGDAIRRIDQCRANGHDNSEQKEDGRNEDKPRAQRSRSFGKLKHHQLAIMVRAPSHLAPLTTYI